MGDNTNVLVSRSPLLPDRSDGADFFICDILDAVPKADMAPMEHPIFSVATKPDHKMREYRNGEHWVKIKPGMDGLATVHDRDVLIYCISQIMAAINNGQKVSRTVRFKAYDLLNATNRGSDGRGYEQLKAALERLAGTQIQTNVTTNGKEVLKGFGLIDSYEIVRETREGRMLDLELTLSDWVFNAIEAHEVLTIHRDYFRLRKPLERRIYEIARKHCGRQSEWKICLEKLHNKCGSQSRIKEFRRLVRNIVKQDAQHHHLPDYGIGFDEEHDMVLFTRRSRNMGQGQLFTDVEVPPLSPETYELARQCAPGWDIRYVESEWRAWLTEPPRQTDKAFLGFCEKWFAKRGRPS